MGTKNNPGNFDCYAAADPDEPIFILRSTDPIAPVLINLWAALRRYEKADRQDSKAAEADRCAASMFKWQKERNRFAPGRIVEAMKIVRDACKVLGRKEHVPT